MTESAFNRPVPVQEQQAALKAEPKPTAEPSNQGEKPEVPLQDRGHLSTHPNFPNGIDIPGVGTVPVHSTAEYAIDDLDLAGLDTVSRGAILDGLRENPITEMLNAPNPLAKLAQDFQAREEAAIHSHARELTEAEATKALEAVMQERIKEALDNDIETRARIAAIPVSAFAEQIIAERGEDAIRYEGTFQGNPIVSNPTMRPGDVVAVRLTAEQLEATKHLQPGEAWAKAGQSLEPEPPAKAEDLDEF